MVADEVRKWVKEWVAGWAKNMFFTRADHKMTSSGTSSHGLPVILDNIGKIDASFLDSEDIADVVGTMVTGNTETGISVTYDDTDNTLDFVLDTEYVQDIVGAMATDSTSIDFSYDDTAGTFTAQRAALTGDVTASANSNATTIANDAVTFAKMQNIATDSLIGRDTAATGDPENITLNATLSMTGSGELQRSALTGDITASAGSNTTTIAADVVDNTKLANMAQATIKGRASGAGTGDPTDLTAAQVATIVNASVDHGTLAGLADDDHTQYMHNSTARTVSARHTMTDGAEFTRASYPVVLVTRTGSAAGLQATFGFKYTKSSAAADGDGPRMIFEINDDSTTTQNIVAGIGAARDGADNSADVVIQAATAGSVAEVARFHKEGDATITGVLTATGATLNGAVAVNDGSLAIEAGTSANDAKAGGVLYVSTTTVGNTLGGEDNLMTYSIPANTLSSDNMSIRFEAIFRLANNANTKTTKMYYGATTLCTLSGTLGNADVVVKGTIIRTGATTQLAWAEMNDTGLTVNYTFTSAPAETLSGAVTIKGTGQSGSSATNDVQMLMLKVSWDNANT